MKKTNEIEYIFDLIGTDLNLILFNDKQTELLDYRKKCYKALDKSSLINMFHQNSLLAFDTSMRLLANIIFERIPNEKNLVLSNTPDFEEFKIWFGSLEYDDFVIMLFYVTEQEMMELKSEEDLQFIVNVFITNKELTHGESNKTDKKIIAE